MSRTYIVVLTLLLFIAGALVAISALSRPANPHGSAWIEAYRNGHPLPDFDNGLFVTSGACESCHGSDPDGLASVTFEGADVNVVDAWRAGLMANSAKDPYWRAKMRQEMLNAPGHSDATGDFCTKCHAPLGRHAHSFFDQGLYTFEFMLTDTAGLDGVSCVACHQQSEEQLGKNHSGDLFFEHERIAYGPFESPLASPMLMFSGYEPVFSQHISDAGICAGCHTLITQTIDLNGEFTGNSFVEQATYHEWLNSIYGEDELNITCQHCHMPSLGMKQPIVLAAGYDTPGRAPFSRHSFAGANVLMLEIMRDHRDTLAINASEDDFNAAIEATLDMLQWQTLGLELNLLDRDEDTLRVELVIENLAGHKFPSGYPARRTFVNVEVRDALTQEVLFVSGTFDEQGYLISETEPYEPHYDVIRATDQVQIYEIVMADVNGNPTTLLEQGAGYLKDNRLVPVGFSTQHAVYDTTLLAGNVLNDPNFNRDAFGSEGTGIDRLHYFVPMNSHTAELQMNVNIWYQSVPPKWVDDLSVVDDPMVAHFTNMYAAANKTPVLVKSAAMNIESITSIKQERASNMQLRALPSGELIVTTEQPAELVVFGLTGRMLLQTSVAPGVNTIPFNGRPGVYVATLRGSLGEVVVKFAVW